MRNTGVLIVDPSAGPSVTTGVSGPADALAVANARVQTIARQAGSRAERGSECMWTPRAREKGFACGIGEWPKKHDSQACTWLSRRVRVAQHHPEFKRVATCVLRLPVRYALFEPSIRSQVRVLEEIDERRRNLDVRHL